MALQSLFIRGWKQLSAYEGNETERICHYELGVSALCAL